MRKSVYSLVLSDDVVKTIDDMAYSLNTSRSNLINQILAEHVSYKTPESLIKDIFECVKTMMDNHFQIQVQASDAILSIRSPLRYKYKPTIRYKVELLKEPEDEIFGRLSIYFRTQNGQLIKLLENFFGLWYNLEKKYFEGLFKKGVEYAYAEGKFIRALKLRDNSSQLPPEDIGNAIGEYVRLLDEEMKIFFEEIENPREATVKIENNLRNNIARGMVII